MHHSIKVAADANDGCKINVDISAAVKAFEPHLLVYFITRIAQF
jgi:hypothetical protein